jgi:hypothetical protein
LFTAGSRSGILPGRAVMLLSIVGDLVVSFGWFGPNLISLHDYGSRSFALLATVVGVHLVFLLAGIMFSLNPHGRGRGEIQRSS